MDMLSWRLQQAIDFLPVCQVIADIGCDHGYAGLALLQQGKAKRVIACDISAPSLEKARRLFVRYGREKQVDFFVCDGLARASGAQAALLAGMGGHTMVQILQKDVEIAHALERLVLQPSDSVDVLRSFLARSGYAIEQETILRDGRLYPLLSVRYTGESYTLDARQTLIGPLNLARMDTHTRSYIQWQIYILQKTFRTPAVSERGRKMQKRNRWLAEQLQALLPQQKGEPKKMIPTVKQIADVLEPMAPSNMVAGFDTCGVQCGDFTQRVRTVLLCLDVTEDVADEAIAKGVDMIISHHPVIKPTVRHLQEQDGAERIIRKLIKADITFLNAHSNLDCAEGGICDVLCRMFDVKVTHNLKPIGAGYFGRMGTVEPITVQALAQKAKKLLNCTKVVYSGDGQRVITKLAIAGGNGSTVCKDALPLGAECVITGDVLYHTALEFGQNGLSMIDAGHYDTEKVILPDLQKRLQNACNQLQYEVEFLISTVGKDVFTQV